MNKKVIALIVVIILLVIIGAVYFMNQNSSQNANENQDGLAQTKTHPLLFEKLLYTKV